MRGVVSVLAGLALAALAAVAAADSIMALLDTGAYLLAALLFVLALGGLAACTVMVLLLRIEDEPR
jgi:hypothetical protein